ncbi:MULTISPECIES: hypothetical protein [unclassified Microbacterium]|uniref:hypothetical protein n=1 Tax=unclassified Microbacterium TaxID=2609290 RepID=UPI000EA97175|nr:MULTISPECIES: hypothetical protein [unclassified Microbacterium]MBT2484782.1 hypothetical protein [Microbacterium sp. ISL-108]RKN67658.1 hypothetical protein D7252_08720 [Microbacterium sp. CGR2]
MTDPTLTQPDLADGTEITPETPPAPVEPPKRSTSIRLDFETEGEKDVTYGSKLDHPHGADPAQYAKTIGEYVERTVLLHLGALPVLSKVEIPTEAPA